MEINNLPSQEQWAAQAVVKRSVQELIPYERNPKIHSEQQIQQIADSIREWGWTVPVVIDESGNVLAGHGRLFAAESIGIEEVPCVVASNWSEEQKKAYIIADNKVQENSSWDFSLLSEEINNLSENGFDLEKLGLSEADINLLQNLSPDEEFKFDYDDVVPDVSDVSSSEPGKTTDGYVEFAVVLSEADKKQLMSQINKVKADYQIESNADALMMIVNQASRYSHD